MLIPFDWLTEYVDTDGHSPQEIAARLTASGTSVERVQTVGEGLDDLIVAEVVEVYPHPNADRLRLAKVNTGTEILEVVCGAPNLAAGQHVAFAPVGAHIPVDMHSEDRSSFTLTKAKIRGIESNGMICSSAEMGLGEEHGGILVLPKTSQAGQKVAAALGYPRVVLDAEVTTNRPDELSIVGVAREVSVLLDRPLKFPEIQQHTADNAPVTTTTIESDSAWRLMAQTMKIEVKPSSQWLQDRLVLAGMRPINNVVDITNFVMLELGQPLHAYDKAKLTGNQIVARQARAGEIMVTLDGMLRTLDPDMLVIADQQPIGVAGIMGGQASMIDKSSKEIVLEAASFDPIAIRRTANSLALRSEASKRFERGVDPELTEIALRRAVDLLVEYAGGELVGEIQDTFTHRPEPITASLSSGKLNQYLGKDFDLNQATSILEKLGFEKVEGNEFDKDGSPSAINLQPSASFQVPSWRLRDVEVEVDLIEEVVRMVGYSSLPVGLPFGQQPNTPINHHHLAELETKRRLAQAGWMEVITLSLTDEQTAGPDSMAISNPLSSEWTRMRTTLLPDILAAAKTNIRRHPELKLFELSKVYLPTDALPDEQYHLALVLTSQATDEQQLMQLKGAIGQILQSLGIKLGQVEYRQKSQNPLLDERGCGTIWAKGQELGSIGRLSVDASQKFDLDNAVVAELDVEDLLDQAAARQFEPLPKFPGVEEDMSLLMDETMPVGPVVDLVSKVSDAIVADVQVISIYRDDKLGNHKKSPLLHITYRADDRTLSSQEIAGLRQQLVEALQKEGIDVRE